jgi:hypothetical protein
VGLAAGVGAVISATAASASGILPTIYAPLLAALLLVCRVRPLVGASPMLDDVVSRVGETVARSALLKKWEAKLGSGGLVVAAWAALQMVAECVGWVVGGGSASIAFVVSALAADIAAATLAIVAACHFTIPSIDFECALLFVLLFYVILFIFSCVFYWWMLTSLKSTAGGFGRAAGGTRREDVPPGPHLAAHPIALERKYGARRLFAHDGRFIGSSFFD